jgi:hypothetical protein
MGHVEVKHLESPDDAPDEAKTVEVSYIFDRDVVNKDFEKTFKDGFDKKGVRVDEELSARAHFGVNNAKITGTVTYVKKRMGRFSIIEANLVAEAHYDADVQLDLDVKVKGDTKKATEKDWDGTALGGKPFTLVKNVMPTNIPIAGPLFLHAHFDLTAACDLGVEGQMHASTGVGIKGDVHLAAKYKKAGFEKEDGKKSRFAFEAKTPNFELAPRPYLKFEGKQQSVKGKCSLQPTAVLLLEHSVGAKLMVEPWIELEASRSSTRSPWRMDAQAGVSVNAATDIELFGRQIRKPKEFTLFEVALTKKGDPMGAPRLLGPAQPANGRRPAASPVEIARRNGAAEDLRTADARPTPDPYAATENASASDASATADPRSEIPDLRTAALTRASAGLPDAHTVPEPAPAGARVATDARTDARTPSVEPATPASREGSDSKSDTAKSDATTAKSEVANANPPAAEPTPTPAAPEPARKRGKKSKKEKAEVATAPAPAPAADPAAAPADAAEPARRPGKNKKTRGASRSASTSPTPDAPATPPAASESNPMTAALTGPSLGRPIGRKPGLAAGVSKLVRRKP